MAANFIITYEDGYDLWMIQYSLPYSIPAKYGVDGVNDWDRWILPEQDSRLTYMKSVRHAS